MTRKPTILIGEDKQFLVDIIKESFGSGFNCICVRTEEKVFENLDSADAVVVGLDVCPREQEERVKMISEIKARKDIPLMALTSLQYSSVRIELLRQGADDVLTKPFNPEELVIRMEKLLSRIR